MKLPFDPFTRIIHGMLLRLLRGFILWTLPAFTLVLGEYVCETGKIQRMKDLCKVDDNLMNNSGFIIRYKLRECIMKTTLKDVIISFVQSIDLYNYLLKDHHRRTAIITWHLSKALGLDDEAISSAVLTAAVHDIGALSVDEKNQLIVMDVADPHPHARLGAYMVGSFDPFSHISQIMFYHHWPYEFNDRFIDDIGPVPLESYVLHVADRIDILINRDLPMIHQKDEITERICSLKGSLFHPDVVDAFKKVAINNNFWLDIDRLSMDELLSHTVCEMTIDINLDILEQLAFTFSKIIDYRSKFTAAHSFGVSEVAYKIASIMDYSEEKCRKLRVAGLLHDIGKIGVSYDLIERHGSLTNREKEQVQAHAYYTDLILRNIESLEDISQWASHHHESHDGSGYPHKYTESEITEEMDILAYADIFTALVEDRPYRQGLSINRVLSILRGSFIKKHGATILAVIENNAQPLQQTCRLAINDGLSRYNIFLSLSDKYKAQTALIEDE